MPSERLEGLRLLQAMSLPVPDFSVVRNLRDAKTLELPDVEYGWTIRTCRGDGKREQGEFFANRVEAGETRDILVHADFREGRHYIIYPSWWFMFSANIMGYDNVIYLEWCLGSQKALSMGRENPEFTIESFGGTRPYRFLYGRQPFSEEDRYIKKILHYISRVPLPFFYAEVAVTAKREVFFYEFFNIGAQRERRPWPLGHREHSE